MTDRSESAAYRLIRRPRSGALLAALLTLAILLPLWMLAVNWYRAELLNGDPGQRSLLIFEVGGLIVMTLLAGLAYLAVNRQTSLSQAVQQRTQEITRINQRLEEDLARRQQMEEELRTSESRSQALLNAIPDMMFRLDRAGTFLDYHADASDMALPPEVVIGGNLRQLPAPDGVVDCMLRKIDAALTTRQIQTLEYSLFTVGGPKDFEARMVADGPQEVVAIVRDITERKQAEQSLHRWAHIFEHAEWGVAIGSADGRTLEMMNPAYARMHGYTVEELSSRPIASVYAPGTEHELRALIQHTNETGHGVMESKHVRKDGAIFPVMVDLTAVKDAAGQVLYRVANVQDITERKRSEAELRRSQQQHEQLVNSIDGIVWEGDAQTGLFTFVSPAAERILGYPLEQWLTDRNFWVDRLHPDDRTWVVDYCAAETVALRPHECEYRMLAADGRNVWLRETVTVIAENNRPRLLRGMLIDTTARKQVEEALREREEQYRSIFEASLDGLFINSLDGYIIDVNPAGARMHGYTIEECRGLRSEQLVPPDRLSGLEEFIDRARAGEHFQARGFDRRKDGSTFPVEIVGTRFTLRGQPHAFAAVRDISAQVQAEVALREREEQYRNVFESSLDGLAINDLDGRLVDFNPAMARMHGYTLDEFRHVQPMQFIHPDSLPLFATFMEAVKNGGEYRCRAMDVRKDGSTFHIEVIGTPFTLRGQPHAIAIVRDISAQVEAEEALREREAQYRSIFESVSDGLLIDTIAGEMIDFNPAVARMHGYTVEEFRRIPTIQIIHPDSLHLFQEFVETVKAGREYRCRAVDVRKDGSLFPVEVAGTPITFRGQRHMLAVLHDITTQVQAEQLLEQRVTERTRELSTLLDVSRNVASTLELEPLLGLILDALKVFVDYSSARINTLEGQVLRVRAARGRSRVDRAIGTEFQLSGLVAEEVLIHRRVLVIPDLTSRDDPWAVTFRSEGSANIEAILAHIRSWMGVPLIARGRVIGNLSLEHEQAGFYDAHQAEVVLALADQVAVALENARLFTEAQGKAVLEERQRLARDLHDSVTQSLYSLTLLAEAGRRLIDVDVLQAAQYLSDMGEIAQQSLKEMRLLVYQLRPLALEHEGLLGALQARLDSVEKRAGVEARFLIEGSLGSLPPMLEEGLFRIAQEALNNALKHAAARSVVVRLRGGDDGLTLEVADDGRGSALLTSDVKGGLGLTSMKERVAQLQGTLTINSAPGQGTRVAVEVPHRSAAEA
ncbi:MAG: PAS domain S-box protein [Chloroflexi bacterium]|nr:PAS domain S-box protein [Chloroflexota bacterium]